MRIQQLVAQNFGLTYGIAARNLEGITHETSLVQPSPGGNCANWILGHMVRVHNGLMQLVGEDPVWETDQLEHAGFEPVVGPGQAIDWETLKGRFLASRERCLAAVSSLSDEALLEMVPHPFGGVTTRAELLNTLAFHQSYHVGQLAIARRFAGLPGAVKGPGQPAN